MQWSLPQRVEQLFPRGDPRLCAKCAKRNDKTCLRDLQRYIQDLGVGCMKKTCLLPQRVQRLFLWRPLTCDQIHMTSFKENTRNFSLRKQHRVFFCVNIYKYHFKRLRVTYVTTIGWHFTYGLHTSYPFWRTLALIARQTLQWPWGDWIGDLWRANPRP